MTELSVRETVMLGGESHVGLKLQYTCETKIE